MKKLLLFYFVIIFVVSMASNGGGSSLFGCLPQGLDVVSYRCSSFGEVITIKGDVEDVVKALRIDVVNEFCVDDKSVVMEGYVYGLQNYVFVGGKKINVQLSQIGEDVVVGYPLIEESF